MIKIIHQHNFQDSCVRFYADREHKFKITTTKSKSALYIELSKWESSGWANLFAITYKDMDEDEAVQDCERFADKFIGEEKEKVG